MINVRQKGHSFERQIAQEFREIGWKEAGRQLEFQMNEAHGIDLKGTKPFAVQLKRRKKHVSITTLDEIKPHDGYSIPLLISKPDQKEAVAVLFWDDLKAVLRRLKEADEGFFEGKKS